MRLNGGQRIGIIASVIWMVVGGFWIRANIVDGNVSPIVARMFTCYDRAGVKYAPSDDPKRAECERIEAAEIGQLSDFRDIAQAIGIAAIVLGVAWILVYFLVGLVRWVSAGFAA
ncbi:hypothetical protein [Bradyrhizobium guangdongense]